MDAQHGLMPAEGATTRPPGVPLRVGTGDPATQLSARLGRSLLSEDQWRTIARSLLLSGREFQILQNIFDDRKELAIAEELGISAHTVHTHLERLYRKLAVGSRCGLIVRVFAEYLALEQARGDGKATLAGLG